MLKRTLFDEETLNKLDSGNKFDIELEQKERNRLGRLSNLQKLSPQWA